MSVRRDVQKVKQMFLVLKLLRTISYLLAKALFARLLLPETSFLERLAVHFK